MNATHLFLAAAAALLMQSCSVAQNNTTTSGGKTPKMYGKSVNTGNPWPAIDELGRTLPLEGEVPAPREGKFVGIFYFLWHNDTSDVGNPDGGPYDLTKIIAKDPNVLNNPNSPYWSPKNGQSYYWGEPLYGYYLSTDEWVIRRHAKLLSEAGVDTLIFDTTNSGTYKDVYMTLCKVFTQIRKEGGQTPQICFMVNTGAGERAMQIYNDLYKPGLYKPLWFIWDGKPLMICDPKAAMAEYKDFFTLRRAHWPVEMRNTENAWHWEATYPQPYGYTTDPKVPEQVNVAVAQNLSAIDGKVADMSSGHARGRGFANMIPDHSKEAIDSGANFNEQWQRAYELDPPFVMITGWNEWWAGRWQRGKNWVFVDQYNQEYSRDIEPAKASHGDNFYNQMVAGIRKYKGAAPIPEASGAQSIKIEGGFDQWDGVKPEYKVPVGEVSPREYAGQNGTHYTNATQRNQFATMKVARDSRNLYFMAETTRIMAPLAAGTWLLLDVNQTKGSGWEGYDYLVRSDAATGEMWLEKSTGGWNWQRVQKLDYSLQGMRLMLAVPKQALGLTASGFTVDFKWADNLQKPGEVLDFYVSGDVAPIARFNYRYSVK
ncbi:MAG: glycoside hydrolase family 71/99 protein [Armatimonadota bacterium]